MGFLFGIMWFVILIYVGIKSLGLILHLIKHAFDQLEREVKRKTGG